MKPARYDLCSCGSGKKFKFCCENIIASGARAPSSAEISQLASLYGNGRYADVENAARALLDVYPDSGIVWNQLGLSLYMQGKDSMFALQQAAQLLADDSVVQNNLGNVLQGRGRFAEAELSHRRALQINPDFAIAHFSLGNALKNLGRLDDAESSYRRALELNSGYVEALNNLARLLVNRGDSITALGFAVQSLQVDDRRETQALFVECVLRCEFTHVADAVRDAMMRALSEPWCRPVDLAWVCTDMIKLNRGVGESVARAFAAWPRRLSAQELYGVGGIAAVADDGLLRCFLESTQVCDFEMERFLTLARFTLLMAASTENAGAVEEGNVLNFYSAMAQQCFINEYVFAWTDAEAELARSLRDALESALESAASIPEILVLVVACYFPLNALAGTDKLLERPWAKATEAVLTQQIREPAVERDYSAATPRLTSIDNEVSQMVRNQYEENPYPRWIKLPPAIDIGPTDALRQMLPDVFFHPSNKSDAPNILLAGCGTGQHLIDVAQRFPGAKVLAIDLSLASLGYARRKSQELGLDRIEYAQADITKLGTLGRSFDLIESCGVLHHLADPFAGWQVLLSLLRPGGLMNVGLYSATARRGVVQMRAFIAEQGYGSTADDIRRCRQALINLDGDATFATTFESMDFFSTSGCRDLLFHVQEQRMTLAEIEIFLRENNLQFIGFEIRPDVYRAFSQRFPEDGAATDLGRWKIFENENPDTFIGMYQFWIRKPV